ncbi:unnamed protein product, partial [marine sediment metagenome]
RFSPGIFMREKKDVSDVISYLNRISGLLGISGKWSDRRDIEREMVKGNKRSVLAFNIEVTRLKKYIGAY